MLVLPAAVDDAAQTIFSKLGAGIHLIQTKQLKLVESLHDSGRGGKAGAKRGERVRDTACLFM